jgi:hypothetical protein
MIKGQGLRVLGYKVLRFLDQDLPIRVQGLGYVYKVQGLVLRVQGSG